MKVKSALTAAAVAGVVGWLAWASWGIPTQIGASRSKVSPYAGASPRYRNRKFHNSDPSVDAPMPSSDLLRDLLTRRSVGRPPGRVPLVPSVAPEVAADVAVTWYGHSSVLVEVDGYRVLADPVWSRRVSPSSVVGPMRLHPTPVALADLPDVDAIAISHDHYDHLDKETVQGLVRTQKAPFVVPVGIGAHLRLWDVPEDRIVELDWDDSVTLGGLTLTCTEARHFSGRGFARNSTQWASWVFAGPVRRVFFGGDSGYTPRFADLGRRYGPFDMTLLPVGAYDERWSDIHMNPEEAVQTHADLELGNGTLGVLVPIHWATFNLAFHPWSEPVERLLAAADESDTTVAVPRPGQRIDGLNPAHPSPWWSRIG